MADTTERTPTLDELPDVLTRAEVCAVLRYSLTSWGRLESAGIAPVQRLELKDGKGKVARTMTRYSKADLKRYLDQRAKAR